MRLLLKSYKLTNFFQKKVLGKSFLYCLFHIFSIAETVFKSRSKAKSNISIITQIYNHYHILYGLRTLSEFFFWGLRSKILYITLWEMYKVWLDYKSTKTRMNTKYSLGVNLSVNIKCHNTIIINLPNIYILAFETHDTLNNIVYLASSCYFVLYCIVLNYAHPYPIH